MSMFVDWREGKTEDGRKGSKIEGVERIKRQRGRGFFLVGKKKKGKLKRLSRETLRGRKFRERP